jgi:ATP-binding cassette subfamily C protein CydD
LLRFFDPQAGAVRIGDVDIRLLSLAELRSRVSVVSQDTFLFHGTIEDNLRFARTDATAEDIRTAAKAAHIDEFIQSLPLGYDTQVGERGAQLSGGQRQRIAIARALLKDAPILVLDEATSSVGSASEQAIQAALTNLAQKRTSIVIAHRLATIRSVDRIFVIERGSLVEVGSHAELSARRGLYSRLSFSEGVI